MTGMRAERIAQRNLENAQDCNEDQAMTRSACNKDPIHFLTWFAAQNVLSHIIIRHERPIVLANIYHHILTISNRT